MPACLHACMHVCMYACMHVCMYACMHTCMYACMHVCMYARMHVCMHACMYTCMHACTYACMYVCMYACMYVCMCLCVYVVFWLKLCCPSLYPIGVLSSSRCSCAMLARVAAVAGSDGAGDRGLSFKLVVVGVDRFCPCPPLPRTSCMWCGRAAYLQRLMF